MNINKMLGTAIEIATKAHSGQLDRQGLPYILHPLHLMNQLMYDKELAIIAVLHDVVEDHDYITIDHLIDVGFPMRVIEALDLLTHKDFDSYEDYILGICNNIDAIRVKRKDLEHNSCITRLKGITQKDLDRTAKYHKAFTTLGIAKRNYYDEQ